MGDRFAEPAIRATNWNGRYLVIGFAAGEIPKVPINLCLLKSVAIVGVFWGAWKVREPKEFEAQLAQIAAWWREGKLKPLITKRYRLNEAKQCLRDVADRKVTGKVVVVMPEPSRL